MHNAPQSIASPVAIIAGQGTLPRQMHLMLNAQNIPHKILALDGIFDDDTLAYNARISWDKWQKVGDFFQKNNIQSVVFVGKVIRPRLRDLRPDWLFAKHLPSIGLASGGDDAVMRKIGELFEKLFKVNILDPQLILHPQGLRAGVLGKHHPSEDDMQDIQRGQAVINIVEQADFGQSVIVESGRVLGIEALEGTDMLIERIAYLKNHQPGGVLVKMMKKQQDRKLDPPVIGVDTLKVAAKSQLHGVAIDQRGTIIVDQRATLNFADAHDLFVYVIASE